MTLPLPEDDLARRDRLSDMADRYRLLALKLEEGQTQPTKDGLGPLMIEARELSNELTALWRDA